MDALLWTVLGFVIYPAWLLVGLLDYLTHQRTHIAATSGLRESALHVVQVIEVGVPVLLVLFFEISASVLVLIFACALVHTITAYGDIAYTTYRRFISPFEQFLHAFLVTLPIAASGLVALLWLDARESAGLLSTDAFVWAIRPRQSAWQPMVIWSVLGTGFTLVVLPAAAEFVQTWRARKLAGEPRSSADIVALPAADRGEEIWNR